MNKFQFGNYKIIVAVLLLIAVVLSSYMFIYKPYFTIEGKILREVREEKVMEEKVLYYACGLPKENKFHEMLMRECNELEDRARYDETNQNCIPNFMGGCD